MCGDTENHGPLFPGMGKIKAFWQRAQKPWEKQRQVQDADSP